jgi:hypothetical protein
MNASAASFENKYQLITKYVMLSTAEQKQKQDVIRHFIFAELNKATDEAQLVAIQSILANSAELKSLFQTAVFFTTNTSL